jgi:O-antigen/teichoic acid export membrane protein
MCPLAFWQATRFALMLFFVYILSSNSNDVSSVSFCFLLTEFFLFIGLVITQLKRLPDMTRGFNRLWLEKHFTFGVKSLMNGVLFEFNTKVDILILGLFTDLKTVGLYSFAAVLLEGILGLYVVIKNQISPYLVQYFDEKKFNTIFDLLKKVSLFSFTVSFLILIATLIFYTSIVGDILQLPEFNESKYFFIILCIGLCFYSIVAPFDNIFLLTSHPLQQSYFAAVMIGSNIGLNFLLTPLWGGYGAAIATACAYFISFLWILLSMKKYINRVFLNRRH